LTAVAGCRAVLRNFDIIIVAGQSNAVGSADSPGDRPLNNVFQLLQNGSVARAIDPLDNYQKVIRQWSGFAVRFANLYAARFPYPGRSVLIVPCSLGNTSLREDWNPVANGPIFRRTIQRISAIRGDSSSRVVAFLWVQGENDAKTSLSRAQLFRTHAALLARLILLFRKAVKLRVRNVTWPNDPTVLPTITTPFILAEIQHPDSSLSCTTRRLGRCVEGINDAIRQSSSIPRVSVVRTLYESGRLIPCDTSCVGQFFGNVLDRPTNGTCRYCVHYGPRQQRWIADRMFEKYIAMGPL